MRRRIYEFDLSDVTDRPSHWDADHPDKALYDEALWEELVKARRHVDELETRVVQALIIEPYDDVEVALAHEAVIMFEKGGRLWETYEDLKTRALANAATKTRMK